jgi:hypothetical protein
MCTGWFENRTEGELARAGGCPREQRRHFYSFTVKNASVSAWEKCAEFALLGGLSQHYMALF